jgi:hypothetical protein
MILKLAIAGALALALSAPLAAQQKPPSLDDAIAICRTTFFINPAKGKMMFDAVPDEHKGSVALICLSYRQGAQDMLNLVSRKPQPRPVSWAR